MGNNDVIRVPIFYDDDGDDVEGWISWVENFFSDHGFSKDEEKFPFVYGFIEGDARTWFEQDDSLTSWEAIKSGLFVRFGNSKDQELARMRKHFDMLERFERWLIEDEEKGSQGKGEMQKEEYQNLEMDDEIIKGSGEGLGVKSEASEPLISKLEFPVFDDASNQREDEQAQNARQVFDKMILGGNRIVRKRKKRKKSKFTKARRFKYKCGKEDSKTLDIQKILQRTEVKFEVERDTQKQVSKTCLLTQLRWLLRVTQRRKKRKRHKNYMESQERIKKRLLVMEIEMCYWNKLLELGLGKHQGNGKQSVVMEEKDERGRDSFEVVVLEIGSSSISKLYTNLRNMKEEGCLTPIYGRGTTSLVTADKKEWLKIKLSSVSGNKELNEGEQSSFATHLEDKVNFGHQEMDWSVKHMVKLIEEDANSIAKKAEMYYKKRPKLIALVDEFHRMYRSLAERYVNTTREFRKSSKVQSQGSGVSGISSSQLNFELMRLDHPLSHRAPGFDYFLGTGGHRSDIYHKDGDDSASITDSELESDAKEKIQNSDDEHGEETAPTQDLDLSEELNLTSLTREAEKENSIMRKEVEKGKADEAKLKNLQHFLKASKFTAYRREA